MDDASSQESMSGFGDYKGEYGGWAPGMDEDVAGSYGRVRPLQTLPLL